MGSFRVVKNFLILILFLPVLVMGLNIKDLLKIEGKNPDFEVLNKYIVDKSKEYNFPPIILKAILIKEGLPNYKWQQFSYEEGFTHETIVRHKDANSYGLGLCQITYPVNKNGDFVDSKGKILTGEKVNEIKKVVSSWEFNVDKAFEKLSIKWTANVGKSLGVDVNPLIIENWFYPIAWYNGTGSNALAYVNQVYKFMTDINEVNKYLEYEPNYNNIIGYYDTVEDISTPFIIPSFNITTILASSPTPYTLKEMVDNNAKLHIWDKSTNTYPEYKLGQEDIVDEKNYCPENSEPFDDGGGLFMYEWTSGVKLQNCKNKDKEFVVFDNGFILMSVLWNKYKSNIDPQTNIRYGDLLGVPTKEHIGLGINIGDTKIESCQTFNNGKLFYLSDNVKNKHQITYSSNTANNCTEAIFTDVYKGDTYDNSIEYVRDKGIFTGYGNGNFQPQRTINRGELAKVILLSQYKESDIICPSYTYFFKKKGEDVPIQTRVCTVELDFYPQHFPRIDYKDVPLKHGFYNYINFGTQLGFYHGDYINFRPKDPITFAEASVFFAKILLNNNIKGEGKAWWNTYINSFVKCGNISSLFNASTIYADTPIKRNEVAFVLHQILENRIKNGDYYECN